MKRKFISCLLGCLAINSGCTPRNSTLNTTDYKQWIQLSDNAKKYAELNRYLSGQGVANIFPPQQLLRSDVHWRACKVDQFTVPPKKYWPHMARTLRLIKQEIIPLVGQLEALSVYRSPEINACIRGAPQSYHLTFHAVDMQTVQKTPRADLIKKLCGLFREKGKSLNMGLGIYTAQRFHIDAAGYRTWGDNHKSSSSPCVRAPSVYSPAAS